MVNRLFHKKYPLIVLLVLGCWVLSSCGTPPGEQEGIVPQEQAASDGGGETTLSDEGKVTDFRPPKDAGFSDRGFSDRNPSDEGSQEGPPPEAVEKPEILTPESFAPIQLEKTEWPLPKGAANETQLHFAIHAGLTVLFGGKTGLYTIGTKTIIRVDKTPVVGLASWKPSEVVVARSKQLYLWDGKVLAPTNFFKNLDGSNITALAERANESFWIGTQQSLWMQEKDQLRQFPSVKGVQSLWSVPSKKLLLVLDAQNNYHALEEKNGNWQLRSFAKEGVKLSAISSFADPAKLDFWAMDPNNNLLLRKSLSGKQAAWWMFRLKPDKDDKETVQIQKLLFQQKDEQSWALTDGDFYQLSEGVARVLSRPKNLKALKTANSTSDGALWLSDGVTLMRFGQAVAATGYKKNVEPMIQANCVRCHKAGGKAGFRPFETYKQVRDKASLILKRIDVDKNMPPGKPLPASQIAIFKSWIAGGYQP